MGANIIVDDKALKYCGTIWISGPIHHWMIKFIILEVFWPAQVCYQGSKALLVSLKKHHLRHQDLANGKRGI